MSIAVFAQIPWREPVPQGNVDASLVSTSAPQTKAGSLDVADVWIKSFANFDDEAQHFSQRGELLSNILRSTAGTLRGLVPGGTRAFTPRVGGRGEYYAIAEARCNAGEVLVSCFGARDAQMATASSDPCGSELSCRLLGIEPIFDVNGIAVGCRAGLLNQRTNLEPTVTAFCMHPVQ